MAQRTIPLTRLTIGMYLIGVDRSWLQTPFLRHKFKIKDQSEIEALRRAGIAEVTIDTEQGLDIIDHEPTRSASIETVLVEHPPPSDHKTPVVASMADRATPLRILVVDDNGINQVVACKFLQKLGCHAEVARNGREALDSIAKVVCDAVLMDCEMPEMNDYEATLEIRRQSKARPSICPSLPSPGTHHRRTNRSADKPEWMRS